MDRLTKPIRAWHWLAAGGLMRDGTRVRIGETYSVRGQLVMCSHGLHACERILDALYYRPGPVVCRVECWGDVQREGDKLVARNRRVLGMIDATALLHEFACRCAEHALRRAHVEDRRCWQAIEAKRLWLKGELSDDGLAAARFAAMAAGAAAAAAVAAWAAVMAADAAGAAIAAQDRLLRCMVAHAMAKTGYEEATWTD